MSDAVWTALIAACLAVAMKLIADRAAAKSAKLAVDAADAVRKALDTATKATDTKLQAITETGDKVHTLVNANMGIQLKISAVALGRVAELTKHPKDIAAWETAKTALAEHERKQASVDAKEADKGVDNTTQGD